jgi:predicted regulator of Ras-like GTPase activity (Roadblock/LC7/MglB family)
MAGEALLAEMEALRDRVAGITDTALATRDGLIIKADTVDVDPDNIAAMAAAMIGLARRMAIEAGRGTLYETIAQGSGGYVATYAVGTSALLVVVGDTGLDTTQLYRESRETVEHLSQLMSGTDRRRPAGGDTRNLRLAANAAVKIRRVVVLGRHRRPPFAGAGQPGLS